MRSVTPQPERLPMDGRAFVWLDGTSPVPRAMEIVPERPVRAERAEPQLDADGLLHHDGNWVAISDAQLPVVALLLGNLGRLVRHADLYLAYVAAGGRGSRESMRSLVHRVGLRVAELGLELRPVRGRGVVLALGHSGPPS